MKRIVIAALFALGFSSSSHAQILLQDASATQVRSCEQLPDLSSLVAYSPEDVARICRVMDPLDGVRVEDLRNFLNAVAALKRDGYGGADEEIAGQLVAIVKLRGFESRPDRWFASLYAVVRAYESFSGVVTPLDAVKALTVLGPTSQAMTDRQFGAVLAYIRERKQSYASAVD